MMKRLFHYGLLSIILICNTPAFAQWFEEYKSTDFVYKRLDSLVTPKHFRIELDPLQLGFQGGHFSMGVGGRLLAYHFYDKISAEVSYIQRYFSTIPGEDYAAISQRPNLDPFKGKELNFVLSYSLAHFSKDLTIEGFVFGREMWDSTLELPVNFNFLVDLRMGVVLYDLPAQTEFKSELFIPEKLHYLHQTRSINLGISYKVLARENYSTNHYGKLHFSLYHEVFVDFLYAPKAFFPDQLYTPSNWSGFIIYEPLDFVLASNSVYDDVTSGLMYSPIGYQFGARTARMKNALGFSLLFGVRPGFVTQTLDGLFFERFTSSIALSYHIPHKVKVIKRNEGYQR